MRIIAKKMIAKKTIAMKMIAKKKRVRSWLIWRRAINKMILNRARVDGFNIVSHYME